METEIKKDELLEKLAEQHKDEIKRNRENCEQIIVWQDGKVIHYKKLEKYQ